ncbi:MAG: DUF1104 domain-containing protein [Sulfurimonas sp.]|nr:DUF1104 domain-containing protein [Sulfurimonas sp.]
MTRIVNTFLATLLFTFSLNASENFSEMSTQELIAIMGFVKDAEKKKFNGELKIRVPTMSAQEKKKYEENLKKK